MRVPVTGGPGFIESPLVEALLVQGHAVRCLVRDDTRRLGWISGLPSVTIAQGGMDEPRSLLEAVHGVDPVYHVAGLTRARAARQFFPHRVEEGGGSDREVVSRGWLAPMRRRIFFICGSMNQTTQMHQISEHLPEYEHSFSPYYCDGPIEILRRLGLIQFTVAGNKLAGRCRGYLQRHGLPIDYKGKNGPYDLVLTCSDLFLPKNIRDNTIVLVQEGITDPESRVFHLVKRLRFLPLWLAGTSTTGLSDAYRAFCVASEGYRDFFIRKGARPEKIVVTGIPNFDDCRRYCRNDFPYRHYVLACTSPLREVFRREDRKAFIRKAVELAGRRRLIFKLHPNENIVRATREIQRHAPGARVFSAGSAEEMIANCDVLITRFSSTAFVGLALGKETYSDFDMDELRRLMPIQNSSAAFNIATVCRRLLDAAPAR